MPLVSAKHPVQPFVTTTLSEKSHPKVFRVTTAAAAAASVDTASLAWKKTRQTLYEVLRVNTTASQTEIKAAYRSLAKHYHPDSASLECDSTRDFIEIHEAYATLSDPASRARYDLSLSSLAARCFGYSTSAASSDSELRFTKRWETDQCW